MSYGSSKYGEYAYGEEGVANIDVDLLSPDLMKYLPWYYQNSKTMIEIQNSISKELGLLYYHIEDLERQFFIDTATWGLNVYEKELGLKTNLGLSFEERREIIKAKLRGYGTVTKEMIKNTAEAFSGGEVDVIEYPEKYYFVVKFIGIKGIPRNMQGFIDMLETIKPAHLGYEFKYTYTVWQMLKDKELVWGKIDTYWQEIADLDWTSLNSKTWSETRKIVPSEHNRTWNDLKVYEGE